VGISTSHTEAYELLATNERIIASSCGRRVKAFGQRRLQKVTTGARRWCSSRATMDVVCKAERERPPPLGRTDSRSSAVEYLATRVQTSTAIPYTNRRPFNCVGVGEAVALGDVEVLSGKRELREEPRRTRRSAKVLKGQDPIHILGGRSQSARTYGGRSGARFS